MLPCEEVPECLNHAARVIEEAADASVRVAIVKVEALSSIYGVPEAQVCVGSFGVAASELYCARMEEVDGIKARIWPDQTMII